MYYKEFITSFDWEHTGEGLQAFYFYGLCRPGDRLYRQRVRRFAGFYMNEDPEAPNYDPKHKIVRSLHNGSRGPKLTPATEQDWGGLPVPGRPERLTRYSTAANIRGDHPLNLCATTLAMTAYMLTHEAKYRNWLLEYAGAWRDRIIANGGNIPTNIGLDGSLGGEWGGKWHGGTFGWNFWPQESGRNYFLRGPRIAMGAAFMLTADGSFPDALRRQIDNLWAARKVENDRVLFPAKHGDQGWYGYTPNLHMDVQRDLYFWQGYKSGTLADPWIVYLYGRDPKYPFYALQQELARIRRNVQRVREDPSTPDTRTSDHAHGFLPVATTALVNLTLGANDPGKEGNILHSQARYFDPERRRAGLPPDVAALVEKIREDGIVLTLVNGNQVEPRTVIVQAGAYAEHQFTGTVNSRRVTVRLAAGAGDSLTLPMKRYAHPPTLVFPWESN
jgi:hypothetical protein